MPPSCLPSFSRGSPSFQVVVLMSACCQALQKDLTCSSKIGCPFDLLPFVLESPQGSWSFPVKTLLFLKESSRPEIHWQHSPPESLKLWGHLSLTSDPSVGDSQSLISSLCPASPVVSVVCRTLLVHVP